MKRLILIISLLFPLVGFSDTIRVYHGDSNYLMNIKEGITIKKVCISHRLFILTITKQGRQVTTTLTQVIGTNAISGSIPVTCKR